MASHGPPAAGRGCPQWAQRVPPHRMLPLHIPQLPADEEPIGARVIEIFRSRDGSVIFRFWYMAPMQLLPEDLQDADQWIYIEAAVLVAYHWEDPARYH